jgi:predicted lipoprotein with Yx(FWY)xxD motif
MKDSSVTKDAYMPRLAAIALPLIVLVVAGCGSSGSPGTSGQARVGTVAVHSTSLGKVLVDSSGRTLYLFEKDRNGRSACSGACAGNWPPVTVSGKPTAGAGVMASLLSTTRRSDGKEEVTYAGHPLYRYAGDTQPGDTNGEGLKIFGAEWYALDGTGSKVEKESGSSAPAGGGYGY